ncbi:phage head closure protein [Ramlibacter sp. MAHUQ-53]|uniref:phage head closure protein n=1 Tax=unclassified Ramlibacter TaxID=2617605 RepID=UPI003639DF4A
MRGGSLDRRVLLQQLGETRDALGQVVKSWATVAEVWANVRHTTGAEAIRGGAEIAAIKASIRIRYRPGVTEAMRVVEGATVYEIKAVLEQDRKALDLVCEVVR